MVRASGSSRSRLTRSRPADELDQVPAQRPSAVSHNSRVVDRRRWAAHVVHSLWCAGQSAPEIPVEQPVHRQREPRADVDPVGDVADRNLLFVAARPDAASTSCARRARAGSTRRSDSASRAARARSCRTARRRLRVDAAESASAGRGRCRSADAQPAEFAVHQVRREPVVAGGNRRVSREDRLRAHVSRSASSNGRAVLLHPFAGRARGSAKALCPSFRCSTAGRSSSARSARSPPTPSRISCRMRVTSSPP